MRRELLTMFPFCLMAHGASDVMVATAADAPAFPEIAFEKHRLPNGLEVILHEDHKLPFVSVNLWYHVGSKDEETGRTGFAHLFEHMMFQGSKHIPGEYIAEVERLGANLRAGGINGTTNLDRTNYFETVPSEALESVLWLESDRMAHLLDALTQEKLDNQRDVVKNERRQGVDNVPYGRAWELILANVFPNGHPYSWPTIGHMEDLDAATLEDVKAFFRKFYTPNNCSLVIAGDVEPAAALELVTKYFGPIAPGRAIEHRKRWVPALESERRVVVHDRVPQERLYLVWPSEPLYAADEPALDLLGSILARGKNSRLYKRLVYEDQIASDVSAGNSSFEIAGLFYAVATARPGHTLAELEAAIDAEIAGIAARPPSSAEVERAKADLEYSYLNGLERIGGFGGKADILNSYNTYLGRPDFFKEDYQRYQDVKAGDVRDAARRFLVESHRLAISFVPETSEEPATTDLDRSVRPVVGPRRPFETPALAHTTLDNGLQIVVVHRPELPKVSTGLFVEAGARLDPAGKAGTAWLATTMMDEGTRKRTALEISAELQRLGSQLGASASHDGSWVTLQALSRNLSPSLDILADVIRHPVFPEKELERLRKQRLDDILQENADAADVASRVFRRVVFGAEHPYGHPTGGDETSVRAITRDDLVASHRTAWVPDRATIVFAGNITLDQASGEVERVFGGWQKSETTATTGAPATPSAPGETQIFLIDRKESAQTQIRVGCLFPGRTTEDYHTLEVMRTILGGGFSSRLNLNLREDKGYTYGAFASVAYGRHMGHLAARAGVESGVTGPALGEFFSELRGVTGERPITAEELELAKDNLIRGYAQNFESLTSLVSQVGSLIVGGVALDDLAAFSERVEAVTLAEVQEIARKTIDPTRLCVVAVGELSAIEQPIRELAVGQVSILDTEGDPITP